MPVRGLNEVLVGQFPEPIGTGTRVLEQGQGIRTIHTIRTVSKALFFFEYRNKTCRYKYRKLVTHGLHLSKKLCRKNLELVIPMRYARSSPMRSARSVHSLPSKTV